MLTTITLMLYIIVRLFNSPIASTVFLLWAALVGIKSIIYILRWYYKKQKHCCR